MSTPKASFKLPRSKAIAALADRIAGLWPGHPVRVAIDGIDAAGKTSLADELVQPLTNRGRQVIRASIDGFHRPRAQRYHRGPNSAVGYYRDSFDLEALRSLLLDPLGPGGNLQYTPAAFDVRRDEPLPRRVYRAPLDAVLLMDGVFLLRPELASGWDFSIFVDISFETMVNRACERDQDWLGNSDEIRARYLRRYIPGQQIYMKEAQPHQVANIIFINDHPDQPELILKGPLNQSPGV